MTEDDRLQRMTEAEAELASLQSLQSCHEAESASSLADPPQIDHLGQENATSTPLPQGHTTQHFLPPSSPIISSRKRPLFSEAPTVPSAGVDKRKVLEKWGESISHIEYLVKSNVTPTKEDCCLVFQFLVIMWCYINNYSSRLLKRFTVYDFVNIQKEVSRQKETYNTSVNDGNKYKYRAALKFNKLEYEVMTYYFKRIRPLWTNGTQLLKDSFDTITKVPDFTERTQSFFYNSKGKTQLNASRICENFDSKMTALHKKTSLRKSTDTPDATDKHARSLSAERDENSNPKSKKKRVSQDDMMVWSPRVKKGILYSSQNNVSAIGCSFNAVSIFT